VRDVGECLWRALATWTGLTRLRYRAEQLMVKALRWPVAPLLRLPAGIASVGIP